MRYWDKQSGYGNLTIDPKHCPVYVFMFPDDWINKGFDWYKLLFLLDPRLDPAQNSLINVDQGYDHDGVLGNLGPKRFFAANWALEDRAAIHDKF